MDRRNFFKIASLSALFGAISLGGGEALYSNLTKKQEENFEKEYKFDPYKGCKNKNFKFSAPLPFSYELIDEIVEINKSHNKCKLTTFYGSLPDNVRNPINGFLTFGRSENPKIETFSDFAKYVKYAQKKGFRFIYLLNAPKPFTLGEFEIRKKDFQQLLDNLKSIGCNDIKVSNTQVIELLTHHKGFNISASTSFEYSSIRQIKNLLTLYPAIKSINVTIDMNRNIKYLSALKKAFPHVNFELMVDEKCVNGCPSRISHPGGWCFISCINEKYDFWNHLCHSNVIYPWNLDLYANLGIKNFKLMGMNCGTRSNLKSVEFVKNYFDAVENGINKIGLQQLFLLIGFYYEGLKKKHNTGKIFDNIVKNMPDINYFIKHGHLCSTECGVSCNYCRECAQKLKSILH